MMPVVRLNDTTFADLKSIATWFGTKTPGETIARMVRETMEQLGMECDDEPNEVVVTTTNGAMQFETTPELLFTKPLAASINGKAMHSYSSWLSVLHAMIGQVKAKGFEGEKLVHELKIPTKAGPYGNEGFKYYPDLGISVQNKSAPDCWKEVDRIAKKWRIPVSVEFRWRQNPKAKFPGKTGVLRSGKSN